MRPIHSLLLPAFLCACVVACDGEREGAKVVSPQLGDPCRFDPCNSHGACTSSDAGTPLCACDPGYVGEDCARCDDAFHRDAEDVCVPDELCSDEKDNPCGPHGDCDDSAGVIACACDTGYEGPRCNLCASGFGRDAYDQCLQLVLSSGAGTTPNGTAGGPACSGDDCPDEACDSTITEGDVEDFELLDGFPSKMGTCSMKTELEVEPISLQSRDGDGAIWTCAAATETGMATSHVMLEARKNEPARIRFAGPVERVSFDYGASSVLALEVFGDGEPLSVIDSPDGGHGTQTFTFGTPVHTLELRAGGSTIETIAIDNLSYEPHRCP